MAPHTAPPPSDPHGGRSLLELHVYVIYPAYSPVAWNVKCECSVYFLGLSLQLYQYARVTLCVAFGFLQVAHLMGQIDVYVYFASARSPAVGADSVKTGSPSTVCEVTGPYCCNCGRVSCIINFL